MKNRIIDERCRRIYESGFAKDVRGNVAHRAQWLIGLLLSATEWRDVTFIGTPTRWPNTPGRAGIQVHDKWYVTFEWEETLGAKAIRLERRKPPPRKS